LFLVSVIPADHHALEQRDSNKEAKKAKLPLSQVFDNDGKSFASFDSIVFVSQCFAD